MQTLKQAIAELRRPEAGKLLSRQQRAFVRDMEWLLNRERSLTLRQQAFTWRLVCVARTVMPVALWDYAREQLDELAGKIALAESEG